MFSASGMLKTIGLPPRAACNAAWPKMVHQAPADSLGTHRNTATRQAKTAGTDYARYANHNPPASPQ